MRKLLEAPAALPISAATLAAHLRITGSDDDAELVRTIRDAVAHVQEATGLQFVAAKWRNYRHRFPVGHWHVRPWPLLSVSQVTYLDGDGTRQTYAAADYAVDDVSTPGLIRPRYGTSWPAAREETQSVQADVVAGCAVPIRSVSTGSDTLTLGVYVPPNGAPVTLTTEATLPTGLSADLTYYVIDRDASARTVKLSATEGGSAIDLAAAGSGQSWLHVAQTDVWHAARRAVLVLAAHWWEHREEQIDGAPLRTISHGVQRAIDTIHQGDDFVRTTDDGASIYE